MGIALLSFSSLAKGLSALHHAARPSGAQLVRPAHCNSIVDSILGTPRPARTNSPFHRAASASALRSTRAGVSTPLRVVRLSEGGEGPGSAGRMVISGRMADVCAELDRLAAREAAALSH